MTDVSIIIPTYNRLWSLPQAVDSCRGNTCKTEIIIVDDGSTDGTWEWLQQQHDVIAIRQSNRGKDWAVNRGFARATGEYVRFLDSDDWCLQGANDLQVELGRSAGADVVVAGYAVFANEHTRLREQPWVLCDDFIAQQLGECDSSHYSAYLFRREFIKDIPHRQEAGVRDDRLFVLEVALAKPTVVASDALAFAHRHHAGERLQFPTGLRAAATNYQHLQIYKRILTRLENSGELTGRRKRAAANILWPLAHWIAYSDRREAADVAGWVLNLVPDFDPPEQGLLGWLYRHAGFARTEAILKLRRILLAPFR